MKNRAEEFKKLVKEYFPMLGICIVFSCCIYYLLISNGLVNSDDGLWENDFYKGGKWVIAIGRWFIPYLDRIRFGFCMEPITSFITLSLFSAGLMIILDLLGVRAGTKTGFLACALFMSSVVICVSLSFRFISPNYGVAFLLNVAAVWVTVKEKNLMGILGGGVLIAFGMGTYQAYIGCACLVFAGCLMINLFEEQKSVRDFFAEILRYAGAMVTGAVLYVLILYAHLKFLHLEMGDYKGADNYSLINTLRCLTFSIPYTYKTFFRHFFGSSVRLNLLQNAGIFVIFFVLAGLFLIGGILHLGKKSKIRAVLFVLLGAAIPLVCNVVLLVATNASLDLHMAGGMALCIPVLLCVEYRIRSIGKLNKCLWKANFLVVLLILYGNVYQVQVDQEAMLAGRTATVTVAETIIQRLNDRGELDSDMRYCILGSPNQSDLYNFTTVMEYSNQYARFGVFNSDSVCARKSWRGVFRFLCGINLEFCLAEEFDAAWENPDVQNMPLFPAEGSILRLDDMIVIKVSE